jgi:hypothetical protein
VSTGSIDPKDDVRACDGDDSNISLFEVSDIPAIRVIEFVNLMASPPMISINVNHKTCSARKMEGVTFFGMA